jgi:multicomponent Na+:H+ antiporter subunit D
MIASLSPALIMIIGAFFVPLLPKKARSPLLLALPLLAMLQLWDMPFGVYGQIELMGLKLTTLRLDNLSFIFGTIFIIAAFLGVIYALHEDDPVQQVASLAYAGSAVGAVLAGDLLTLFLYWEGTAIFSVFLIWASRTESSYRAGMRYIIIQVASGVLLMAGALLHYKSKGSLDFNLLGLDGSLSHWLIFLAFGIKCAFPLLHNWVSDAYPEAAPGGTVFLSAFTTKLAVYVLARGFPGTELLIPIGLTMALFTIIYALIENDFRRVIAYALINQLGFMVVGIGIGTELAINGAAAHAFAGILYKGLLFMAMGAVLYRTGSARGTDLGGLAASMPWTATFCLIGAASISAFPLFAGFASKSLILSAAMKEEYFWTWLILLASSGSVIVHTGLRLPWFAFFSRGNGKRYQEAPGNMLVAMGLASAGCIGVALLPGQFYALLPHAVTYDLYTLEHVITQLQVLAFGALVFFVFLNLGVYTSPVRGIVLDTDWFYRKFGAFSLSVAASVARWAWGGVEYAWRYMLLMIQRQAHKHYGPDGAMGRTWATGQMAFWATAMIAAYALIGFYYYR